MDFFILIYKKSFYTFKNDPAKPNSLNNDIINSICPDPLKPDKILWLGTSGGGLNRFNIDEKHFLTLQKEKDYQTMWYMGYYRMKMEIYG